MTTLLKSSWVLTLRCESNLQSLNKRTVRKHCGKALSSWDHGYFTKFWTEEPECWVRSQCSNVKSVLRREGVTSAGLGGPAAFPAGAALSLLRTKLCFLWENGAGGSSCWQPVLGARSLGSQPRRLCPSPSPAATSPGLCLASGEIPAFTSLSPPWEPHLPGWASLSTAATFPQDSSVKILICDLCLVLWPEILSPGASSSVKVETCLSSEPWLLTFSGTSTFIQPFRAA